MRTRILFVLLLLTVLLSANVSWSAPISWIESVDGDLSGDRLAPTPLAFDVGVNRVSGSMGLATGQPFDADVLTFEVTSGRQLVGIELLALEPDAPIGEGIFVAIGEGVSIAPFDATLHLGDALVAGPGDVLAQLATGTIYGAPGFTAPLGAGSYTFWIQETSTRADYELAFTVVPEPGSALMIGMGLTCLSIWRRRIC